MQLKRAFTTASVLLFQPIHMGAAQYQVPLTEPAYLACIVAGGKKLPNIPSATIRSILPAAPPVKQDSENVALWFNMRVGDQSVSLRYYCKGKPPEMDATLIEIGK